jgi:hypothetical protein
MLSYQSYKTYLVELLLVVSQVPPQVVSQVPVPTNLVLLKLPMMDQRSKKSIKSIIKV